MERKGRIEVESTGWKGKDINGVTKGKEKLQKEISILTQISHSVGAL